MGLTPLVCVRVVVKRVPSLVPWSSLLQAITNYLRIVRQSRLIKGNLGGVQYTLKPKTPNPKDPNIGGSSRGTHFPAGSSP